MKKELCLQSVEKLSLEDLLKKINAKNIFRVLPSEDLEEKKEIILRGEEQTAVRRFQRLELQAKQKEMKVMVRLEEGVIITNDTITRQYDLYLGYSPKSREQLRILLKQILESLPMILVEPDVYERVKQNQGSFDPTSAEQYKSKTVQAGLCSHLFWQIYIVNQGWADFLHKATNYLCCGNWMLR